jgi:hypothetical protein
MADETEGDWAAGAPRRRREPPTIEGEAEEIASASVPESHAHAESAAAGGDAAGSEAHIAPDQAAHAALSGYTPDPAGDGERPHAAHESAAHAPPPADDALRRRAAWLPFDPSWPLVTAAVAIGALAALVVIGVLWELGELPNRQASVDSEARLARIETQVRDLTNRPTGDQAALDAVHALDARVSALEQAPRAGSDAALAGRVAALETAMKPLTEGLADLNRRADQATAAARAAREQSDAAMKSFAAVARQSAEGAQKSSEASGDVDALAQRIASLERTVQGLRDEVAKLPAEERAVRLAVAAQALKSAVERGAPFTAELDVVRPLVPDSEALAALAPFAASGVSSAQALAREASALTPELAKTITPSSPSPTPASASPLAGILDKLQANAERLVRIRPIEETGDDPAAVIGRIEVKAARGDVDGVLAEADKLPPATRAPLAPWIKKAQARKAALAAAATLSRDALAALGRAPGEGPAGGAQGAPVR